MAVKYPAFRKKFPLLVTGSLLALQPAFSLQSFAAEQYDCQASPTGGWACAPKSAASTLPPRPVHSRDAVSTGGATSQAVAKRMVARGRGTILFTGATAGLRGSAGFAAFSGAKHGIRALAQSMARELGPMNIHVAHVVVDGAIDTAFIRDSFPERYALKDQDGILNPAHIADNYWHLHSQPRDAWTFELDLRPWTERW